MNLLEALHRRLVFARRARVIADVFCELLPRQATVLDIGCGDGAIDYLIQSRRPDVSISGIDIMIRSTTHIPVQLFDGACLPFDDGGFDIVQFIDVLHHTEAPETLLREAFRVARSAVLIKDHLCDNSRAHYILRLMDWIGNAPSGVVLPYNYWSQRRWHEAFDGIGVPPAVWVTELGLYPAPFSWIFDGSLHFVSRHDKPAPTDVTTYCEVRADEEKPSLDPGGPAGREMPFVVG